MNKTHNFFKCLFLLSKPSTFRLLFSLLFVVNLEASTHSSEKDWDWKYQRELEMAARSADQATQILIPPLSLDESLKLEIRNKYSHVDPNGLIEKDKLISALAYFEVHKSQFTQHQFIGLIDFDLSSKYPRFFLVDLIKGDVNPLRTAHGKNSDPDHDGFATQFSNIEGSLQSSVGVYRTAETYQGTYGLSMRLDGLSETNSKARQRAIVIHAADYVQEKEVIQGRSWGCPAVAPHLRDQVLRILITGSMIYAASNIVKDSPGL